MNFSLLVVLAITGLCLLLLMSVDFVAAIRVKSVRFSPKNVQVGDDLDLICAFDLLPNERIYSLKWYKEEVEFFRIEPRSNRSVVVFPVKGIHLDRSRSGLQRVHLRNVNQSTAGTFVCEVSAEGSFFTDDSEAFLVVHSGLSSLCSVQLPQITLIVLLLITVRLLVIVFP